MQSHRSFWGAVLPIVVLSCQSDLSQAPDAPEGVSVAFGRWTPAETDTCTEEIHNSYSIVGPDGKLYPTWHPPLDPSGCSFGHDHGRDPSGSALFAEIGHIPLGYANEQLDAFSPPLSRHEDHVGHKIEWENNVEMNVSDGALFAVTCDIYVKLHQGTHSKDAYTNNLHELVYHLDCNDGSKMSLTMMAAIGTAGEFVASCDRNRHVTVGPPSPLLSPNGGGRRIIPDRLCANEFILVPNGQKSNFSTGLRESWQLSQSIRTNDGRRIAHVNPYFQVIAPSRFFDPAIENAEGRPIDLCYEVEANGDRANGSLCNESTASGQLTVGFADPQSRFNGADRFVDINSNDIFNAAGPTVWYTDPFGKNAITQEFPGSVRQFIAQIDNEATDINGPQLGRNRDYGPAGLGVHPPN